MYNRLENKNLGDEDLQNGKENESSLNVSSTPTSGGRYGSMSAQEGKTVTQSHIPWCGLVVHVMMFFGLVCSWSLRQGISVAIVAMVNQTAVSEDVVIIHNVSDDDHCPRDPKLRQADGEFDWDRTQQGFVLAAYYYGYVVTQVCSVEYLVHCYAPAPNRRWH